MPLALSVIEFVPVISENRIDPPGELLLMAKLKLFAELLTLLKPVLRKAGVLTVSSVVADA